MELLVAITLSSFLSLGLVRIASGTLVSFRLQDSLADIHEAAQVATDIVGGALRSAAYHEAPWMIVSHHAVFLPETLDGGDSGNDQLALIARSDRNCFDSVNEDRDSAGFPRYYLKKTMVEVIGGAGLALSCSFGASDESMVLQIRRQGLIPNVESLQLLFGEDSNSDQMPDRWVRAGEWADELSVVAVRTGLMLRGNESVGSEATGVFSVLDQHLTPPRDGKLRRLVEFTTVIRGRLN